MSVDSDTIDSFEAKAHLPELLHRVEQGETIVITDHGKAVAKLVPVVSDKPLEDVEKTIEEMREFQEKHGPILGGISMRELIEEGRRF